MRPRNRLVMSNFTVAPGSEDASAAALRALSGGGTVFVGLREDNVTLLGKVSCLFRTQKALKDGTYIVGAFEVSDEHSFVIGMNAQFFVQQVLKVLSSFSIVHCYRIRILSEIFCSACNMSIKYQVGTCFMRLAEFLSRCWANGRALTSCGLTHTCFGRKQVLIYGTKLPNSKRACSLYPAPRRRGTNPVIDAWRLLVVNKKNWRK